MKRTLTAAACALALLLPATPAHAAGSGLSFGGCVKIEEAWYDVSAAMRGLGSEYTMKDAAAVLKRAAQVWSDDALLARYAGAKKNAAALEAGASAARKLRVKFLNVQASGVAALANAIVKNIGKTIVPACERQFNK